MDCTATNVLHYIYSLQFMWLVATLIIQPASPFGAGVVCQQVPGLEMTKVQQEMCIEYPNIIHIMFEQAVKVFKHHCYNSFKDHQWNCRGIDPPMFATVQKFLTLETREAAFVYALTSAVVVHTVADKLTENNVKCASLDRSLLPEGQKWVGCSPDIHFSILFAKNFMDSRVDNENVKFRSFVQRNSEIGRLAVLKSMRVSCECAGGINCRDSCKQELPDMETIVNILKEKYEMSVFVSIVRTSARAQLIQDSITKEEVKPSKMIYFSRSLDYCERNDAYQIHGVSGRSCTMVNGARDSCDNLCCGRGHKTRTVKKQKTCECKFVWCCEVKCRTCEEDVEEHRCK